MSNIKSCSPLISTAAILGHLLCVAQGKRPYEMEWANRHKDDHPPLVAFTDTAGWRVETQDAAAHFEGSREELLFGDGVAKLTYRAAGADPIVTLLPPAPIAINAGCDAATCWVYGNNHSYRPDPATPPVDITLNCLDAEQRAFAVNLGRVSHKEWFMLHHRFPADIIERVRGGATLVSLTITNGKNTEDRCIYLNSLALFKEPFAPLSFQPRPRRGHRVFPNCDPGVNTGSGTLPFPDTPLTIIPRDPVASVVRVAKTEGGGFMLVREGEDGRLEVRLPSKAGAWDDLAMRWTDHGGWFYPRVDGGIYFAGEDGQPAHRPDKEAVRVTSDGKSVLYQGTIHSGKRTATVSIRYRLIGKSLVADIQADGGEIEEVRFGYTSGLENPRLVPLPYYTYGVPGWNRPHLIVSGSERSPLFLMEHIDWTQSNATTPFSDNCLRFDGAVASNGGTRYLPKTDGCRNPCFERFVNTLSPNFDDVLPNIPNPVSPWKHITGTRVWRPFGAYKRESDIAYWRRVHRWGMREMVVTDHETGWRDGNESFTFRVDPAPGKGGDKGQYDYARAMQDELGFVYGPYNNYTDFAPVNGFWHIDLINRSADNQLQRAWTRCYAPKAPRAVEFCERLAPRIQEKFRFSTAYCDVHTAVTPWSRVDYDPRVPGAGTFAAVFYAYGEIMLLQRAAWQGPVYSEGRNHFPYCGLADGNYAQDPGYNIPRNPWLVDFDLRRMHDLCCNFGMGSPSMFYGKPNIPDNKDSATDRFLAATIAFGHPGFLLSGSQYELRSYYMVQALASHYTHSSADTIRYLDSGGALWDTSSALVNNAYQRSQILTRYTDGTVTAVNGHPGERMRVAVGGQTLDLPPNGYWGESADGKTRVFSGDMNGHRVDISVSPGYTYLDGRGVFTRFPEGATDGQAICRADTNGLYEILLHNTREAGFPFAMAEAVELDATNGVIGAADVRVSRGLSYVQPVKGGAAHGLTSLLVRRMPDAPKILLTCDKDIVKPGDRVVVRGAQEHEVTIPDTAKPGERLWYALERGWIDFTVAIPATTTTAAVEVAECPLPVVFAKGIGLRDGTEHPLDSAYGANLHGQISVCGEVAKNSIFMHPPYRGGTGYTFARYNLDLSSRDLSWLKGFVGKRDGGSPGDGILFKVMVEDNNKARHEIMRKHVARHEWQPFEADLRPWRGKHIALLLIADVGEKDNSTGDWAAWGELTLTP